MNSPDDSCSSSPDIRSACAVGQCTKRTSSIQSAAAGHSDIGTVRRTNDDLVFASHECHLYIVLDGVGGHTGGGKASEIVLQKLRASIESLCGQDAVETNQSLEERVHEALHAASKSMLHIADEYPELAKMSTVFALAYLANETLLYTHVGDCRVYLVRNGTATQLTTDETFVQLMVDEGTLSPDQVGNHPWRNVILNSVGTTPVDRTPEIHSKQMLPGDVVVLTSDGVTDYLSAEQIASIAMRSCSPQERAKSIVDAALDAESRDNVSCVVVDVEESNSPNSGCEMSSKSAEEELRLELAKLHELLPKLENVDPTLYAELDQVAHDIQDAMHKSSSNQRLSELREQLNEKTVDFESKHPQLTTIAGRIADILAGFGI